MKHNKIFRQVLALTFGALLSISARADGVNEPIPSFYQEPGISPNRGYVDQHANERVDPFTGKLQWHFVDLFIPGNGGMDIKVQRSYSSLNETLGDASPFGIGWTMHFGRVLRKANIGMCELNRPATVAPVFELPDGSRQIFYDALNGTEFISTGFWKAKCTAGGLNVFSPDGTRYELTTAGGVIGADAGQQSALYTTRMIDRNGNVLNFTYKNDLGGSITAISTITALDGRAVTFSYTNGALSTVSDGTRVWKYRLTSVISALNGPHFFLNEVERPDGAFWKFEYNLTAINPGMGSPGGYSIRRVTNPTGGAISYTYSFVKFSPGVINGVPDSTVIYRKEANDAVSAVWTYYYTPATEPHPVGVISISPTTEYPGFDRTRVIGPEGERWYLHYGYRSGGGVWKMGLMVASAISTTYVNPYNTFVNRIETFSWDVAVISNQANQRPGASLADPVINMPILVIKGVSQNGQSFDTTFSNFDAYWNPTTIVETGTDTRTTTVSYFNDASKWIVRQKKDETTNTIGTITRTFDANANLLTETRYGVPTTYTYTPEGDVASKKDARNKTVAFGNYKRGIPQLETHPESITVSRIVSNEGNVVSETDGENATTAYSYDALNRIKSITYPAGNAVTVDWVTSPALSTRATARGAYRELINYDVFGRAVRSEHTNLTGTGVTSVVQTYRYDVVGKKTFASYPNSPLGTGYFHDLLGQPVYVYHEYNPSTQQYVASRTIDHLQNQVLIYNERGKLFTNTYRFYGSPESGQLMKIEAPERDASVLMTRNGLGQLLTVQQEDVTGSVQGGELKRTYEYDAKFYLTKMTEPEVGTTIYGRDEVGNMISRQVVNTPQTTFGYDDVNRLVSIAYPAGTPSVTKTYFRDGLAKRTDNGVASHDYLYDANKNKKSDTLSVGGQIFVTQYSYDGNDALSQLTYGSGQTISFAPDGFGRPTRAAPYVTSASHHANGQLSSFTFANGLTTNVALNERQWPKSMKTSSVSDLSYSYDGLGNVYSIQDIIEPTRNRTMSYDGVDRLTIANGGSWGGGTITYDGRGNIRAQALGTSSPALIYSYDSLTNRLSSITGGVSRSFSYDAYGNVSGNGVNTFTYNDASNLRCANCGLANEVKYDYDADNMRVRSTKGGVATYYVYGLGGSLLWETVPGVSLKEYIYLNGKQVAERKKNG
jgi:YD repeat-containing protein